MKAQPIAPRPFSLEPLVRGTLIAAYVAIIVVCFTTRYGPRIFWTMALPLLIISIVLMGYNTWRRICPLAFWGTFGVRFRGGKQKARKVPEWMERWFFVISLGFLVAMLVVRLVLINGDGPILGFTLILIGGLAAFVNYSFSGRAWCNFICPVGTVERIYTDPNSLRMVSNSQCAKCTACKRHCPDIDQENAYWKDVTLPSRKIAFFSFPGVVLGFYTYYFLRAGTWEAYFDGRWTRHLADFQLAFGPGFFFAPWMPALPAAILTLLSFAAASYLLFSGVEWLLRRREMEAERARHLVLSLAAFAAFNIFYLFAGAPTLRLIPGATRLVAFIVPLVSTLFLYKRWRRQSEDYVKVKSAKHLLPLWKSKAPPPRDPVEIFSYFQGKNEAHAAQVSAYEEVVREMLANGEVMPRDLGLLAQMRTNLDISETEHRKIFSALSEEDRSLFDPARATSVEKKLQLQGYQSALTQLLLRQASPDEFTALQQDYGIEPEVHEAVLKGLRGDSSPLAARMKKQAERLAGIRTQIACLDGCGATSLGAAFLADLLRQSEKQHQASMLEALQPLGDAQFRADLRRLTEPEPETRAAAWENIRAALGAELSRVLEQALGKQSPMPSLEANESLFATMEALLSNSDPNQRAGAALLLREQGSPDCVRLLRKAMTDQDPLVRETAVQAAPRVLECAAPDAVQALQADPDPLLQRGLARLAQNRPAALCTFEKMMYLHQVPLFASLSAEDLYELSVLTQELTVRERDTLVREGERGDDLYVITAGQTEASVLHGSEPRVIGSAAAGSVIGEMSVIDGHPRSATVTVTSPQLEALRIHGEDFRRVLANRADLSVQIMQIITTRLRQRMEAA